MGQPTTLLIQYILINYTKPEVTQKYLLPSAWAINDAKSRKLKYNWYAMSFSTFKKNNWCVKIFR